MNLGNRILAAAGLLLSMTSAHADADLCRNGFVWREAFPNDHVCVIPAIRAQAAADNRMAGARREPNGGPYGPDTCKQGYVWREANPADHVCVAPKTRSQAAADNRAAITRIAAANHEQRLCTLYEHRDYGGASYVLHNGDILYMIRNPDPDIGVSDGIHRFIYEPSWNDKLSSFKVQGGCTLTLWEHVNQGGNHWSATSSYSYVGEAWNDKASQADCTCPGLPNW